jgi:hypothetical protein
MRRTNCPNPFPVNNEIPILRVTSTQWITISTPNGLDDAENLLRKVIEYKGNKLTYAGFNEYTNEAFFIHSTWDDSPQQTALILSQ